MLRTLIVPEILSRVWRRQFHISISYTTSESYIGNAKLIVGGRFRYPDKGMSSIIDRFGRRLHHSHGSSMANPSSTTLHVYFFSSASICAVISTYKKSVLFPAVPGPPSPGSKNGSRLKYTASPTCSVAVVNMAVSGYGTMPRNSASFQLASLLRYTDAPSPFSDASSTVPW